jgi:hypothetical protein
LIPVDVLDPLDGQRLALAANPAAVFVFRRRHPDHGTDARLAALVSEQRANQGLAVDPVGLGPATPTRGRDRGRIDNAALNPLALQYPMNPEAIQSRLLNDDDRKQFPSPRKCPLFERRKARQ